MRAFDRSGAVLGTSARNWFKTKSDYVLYPADITINAHWKSRRGESPFSKAVRDIEIWTVLSLDLYNHQPVWSLSELRVTKPSEALEALSQFLSMVSLTSENFCWRMADPGSSVEWRKHGWKHICYNDIQDFWNDYRYEPAVYRAQAIGNALEIQTLFRAAAARDPAAVGRVWSLFPHGTDHEEIIEEFFEPAHRPTGIPDPLTVAKDLVHTVFCGPNDQADLARKRINELISRSTSRGIKTGKGRPRIMVSPSSLGLMLKLGQCLAVQVRQVSGFLDAVAISDADRLARIQEAYPWIRESLHLSIMDFISFSPRRAAAQIVSHTLKISPSALEKIKIPPSAR